jgi:2'-5' RNA ligase
MAEADAVASEMAAVASTTPAMRVRFTRTEAMPDAFGTGTHVFLLPDQDAAAALTTVHDGLYAGILRPHLRADLPFIPHVTVSGAPEMRECQRLAAALHERAARVSGTLSDLVLVDVTTRPVTPLARYQLGSSSGTNISAR